MPGSRVVPAWLGLSRRRATRLIGAGAIQRRHRAARPETPIMKKSLRLLPMLFATLGACALGAQASSATVTGAASTDSVAVVQVLERFRAAAAAADSATMLSLLAPDAVVLESGGAENVTEFRAHHMAADIEFARAVQETRAPLRLVVRGDLAWAAGTSTAQGQFRGRAVNSSGAELMVFTRTPQGWRIAAIHWSSRRRG